MFSFSPEEKHALLLSTLAGLSTSIGGAIAIIKRPGPGLLAFLLGVAIGVMFTLSAAEMYIRNAYEHGFWSVTAAVLGGVALYYFLQPFLPDFVDHNHDKKNSKGISSMGDEDSQQLRSGNGALLRSVSADKDGSGAVQDSPRDRLSPSTSQRASPTKIGSDTPAMQPTAAKAACLRAAASEKLRSAELLRLGFVMALAMTLHNMPEGFAVAFSAFTDFGAIMALAIAVHNIPEGVIVAAPVFAATGSRWKAMGVAVASGLSEPVGALIALLFVKPFLTPNLLQYMLAFVGGIMISVCGLELWPEARKCEDDWRLGQGVLAGTVIMGWTLYIGI
ncbi:hypothetical protein WJX75_005604 [Coccomyxa subellipsoidea]|uniref:Zinc/iron permease n=1 Tax=Coccomyxa subellipsoidea TaxID=248742 RepID=A0ABR2YBM2_9CHLO